MLKRASQWIVQRLEDVFGWYGGCVARRPLLAIASCVLVTGLALVGLLRYRTENNAFKLWIPDNSDFVANFAWLVRLCGYLAAISTISTTSAGGEQPARAPLQLAAGGGAGRLGADARGAAAAAAGAPAGGRPRDRRVRAELGPGLLHHPRHQRTQQRRPPWPRAVRGPVAGAVLPRAVVQPPGGRHHGHLPGAEHPRAVGLRGGRVQAADPGGHSGQGQ